MSGAPRQTLVDLLRHGEPVGGRRYRGQIDDPLSDKGWRQMSAATAGEFPWQRIVSSPLSRCRAFAEALAAERGLPLSFDERLKEVGFGDWEGRTAEELKALDPTCVLRFKQDPVAHRPHGAEALDVFHARIGWAFEDLLAGHAGEHVLVVAHAGVMRMVIAHVLGLDPAHAYRLQIGSAAMARVRIEEEATGRHAALLWLTSGAGP